MTEAPTKRDLLLQAADILKTVIAKEHLARQIKIEATKMAPGQCVEIQGQVVSREDLLRVAADLEAEIRPVQQRAWQLHRRAFALKG